MTGLNLYQSLGGIGIEQLLGIAIASTLLCVCGMLVMSASRRHNASTRFCIWQATCSAIVLSSVVLSVSPGVPLRTASVEAPSRSALIEGADSLSGTIAPHSAMPAEKAQASIPVTTAAELPKLSEDVLQPHANANARHSAKQPPARRFDRTTVAARLASVPVMLAAIWLVVLILKVLSFWSSAATCYAITRRASRDVPAHAAGALEAARQRIGLTPPPLLVMSDEVSVPFTLGLSRSVIVLPACAEAWPVNKLEMVIAHELAHIERRDLLWHWIGKLAVCIAWFNPLVWLAARRGVFERERACDDRVIAAGVDAVEYGNCLIEIAAAMSRRAAPLAAGVSMAEPPLQQRLRWILSTSTDRGRPTTAYRRLLTLVFVALAAVSGIVRPLAIAPAAPRRPAAEEATDGRQSSQEEDGDDTASNDSTIELTEPVTGTVTDLDGNPIVAARVVVRLVDFGNESRRARREITMKRWQTETDATGTYSIDTSGLGKQPARYCFGAAQVDKPGFAQQWGRYWPTVKEVSGGQSIKATKLSPGRKVSGRIASAAGEPIGGIVKAAAKPESGQLWFAVGTRIPDSGEMELFVPVNADSELVIYTDDHAPKRIAVSQEITDLGTITLSPGTRVSGRLLDARNKPVAGAVVQLASMDHGKLDGLVLSSSRVTLTDGGGKFTLPPAAGKCILSVVESTHASDQIGNESVTGITPPLVAPRTIDLTAQHGSQDVTIREGVSFSTIKGTARWEDGEPAKGLEVFAEADSVPLAFATTDASGNYEFKLPKGIDVYVVAIGAYRDDDRSVWYMAHGSAPLPASGNSQIISIDNLSADAAGVDWELRTLRASPTTTVAEQRAREAFAKLRQAEIDASEKFQTAQTPEESERLDPRNTMAAKYLAFERAYRGDKHAVQAIVQVLQGANSVGDPDSIIAQARIEMVDRLIEFYLGHEDLADTFHYLDGGPRVPRADTLLRLAAGRSPHSAVRAAALLTRAELAKQKLRYAQRLPELERQVAAMKSSEPLGAPTNYAEAMQRKLNALKAIDQQKLREQAGRWLDTIAKVHATEAVPHLEGHTFGSDAEALRFAIDRVIIGAEAPRFEAEDIDGKMFRLSDHRGKIVVLSFNQDIFDSAKNLPHQTLPAAAADIPLEVVTIVATPSQAKFRESGKTIEYKGTLIWEPLHGPYQSRWGIDRFPTSFVVDPTGKLLSAQEIKRLLPD